MTAGYRGLRTAAIGGGARCSRRDRRGGRGVCCAAMQPVAKPGSATPRSGRHFLQIPGPTNVPERVLRAMARPTIDHRGPDFAGLAHEIFDGLRVVFGTPGPVVVFPSSGTGAWEAAIVNTLKPGDRVVMFETGQFAQLWKRLAERLGLVVDYVPGDWRRGADPAQLEARLAEDRAGAIKAVMVVHNETSTGAISRIPLIREAIDRARHGALLMVDTISSLASIEYRHAEWGVDVSVGCSQKGLMLPPGLGLNAISDKALAAARQGGMPRSYWDWEDMLKNNAGGYFPYTPATNLLYGLREALAMLREQGLAGVFARHARHAEATRRAVRAWGLEILCAEPAEYSNVLTAVMMPAGHDADAFRGAVLSKFDMSLGVGLGKLAGKIFRIGHLGDFNDLTLVGTLGGIEMGLAIAGVPHRAGGVQAAMAFLADGAQS
jgi:alanine-glyoxylate transaminase/serine-glyoxylate transaminase/serine-pyruvate transaminase